LPVPRSVPKHRTTLNSPTSPHHAMTPVRQLYTLLTGPDADTRINHGTALVVLPRHSCVGYQKNLCLRIIHHAASSHVEGNTVNDRLRCELSRLSKASSTAELVSGWAPSLADDCVELVPVRAELHLNMKDDLH